MDLAERRAAEQTAAYGHDSGYFSLGRDVSSHFIGCLGEVMVAKFLRSLVRASQIVLAPIGDQFDLHLTSAQGTAGIHVKTGEYSRWPPKDQPFGVHFAQRLEMTGAALILASLVRGNREHIRVEGLMTPAALARCRVISAGELFPGRRYASRTTNRLTFLQDYRPVTAVLVASLWSGAPKERLEASRKVAEGPTGPQGD
jgi:hypothetical protein